MSKVEIYDKAMCCSTGVCGPQVDPELPKFAADLEWLKSHGHTVKRFNLSQHPAEYVKHVLVQRMLADEGVDCLPLVIVDERVVSRSEYPSRKELGAVDRHDDRGQSRSSAGRSWRMLRR